MRENMKKEMRNAVILFTVFNIINFITIVIGKEIAILHFIRGGLAGLAFTQVIIGLLPESTYVKLKNFKNSSIPFTRLSRY